MVQNKVQKSKTKSALNATASSKKATAETAKATILNNGSGESDETENLNNELEVKAGPSNGRLGNEANTDMPQDSKSLVNGEQTSAEVEPEINSEATQQLVKSAKGKAYVENSSKSNETEKEVEKTSISQSRAKEMQQKDTENMEIDIEPVTDKTSEDTSVQPPKAQKRKAESTEISKTKKKVAADLQKVDPTSKYIGKQAKVSKTVHKTKTLGRKKKSDEPAAKTKEKRQKLTLCASPLHTVSGKVFVIGQNDVGQLGLGEEIDVRTRPALLELPQAIVDIVAGGMHSVCLTESGEVLTFGCNDEGALGRRTDEGTEYIPRRVEIPERVVQIAAGDSHSAALTDAGHVFLWGNFRNVVGNMGLTIDGLKQINPIRILKDKKIVKISSGSDHLACLSHEGIVYTVGCGESGQLGRLSERTSHDGGRKGLSALLEPAEVPVYAKSRPIYIEDIWTGSYSTFLKARTTGLIYAFGLNNYDHLGHEGERVLFLPKQVKSFDQSNKEKYWLQLSGGQHHSLALNSDGLVYALGRGDYGRLGLGENCGEKSVPTVIPTLETEKCSNISSGNCVSFAVTEEGSVFSWGMGTNHQLGHGSEDDCHVPRRIEGNFLNLWKAYKISGGGQHTLILACPKESSSSNKKK